MGENRGDRGLDVLEPGEDVLLTSERVQGWAVEGKGHIAQHQSPISQKSYPFTKACGAEGIGI